MASELTWLAHGSWSIASGGHLPVIAQDPERWAQRVRAETSTEPVVLRPGEKIRLRRRRPQMKHGSSTDEDKTK